jgi:predicted alpha/beta-fold hydrolase
LHAIVNYNGYDDLMHYYTDMSAMGDSNAFQDSRIMKETQSYVGKIENISIPFCVLHALDDPLVTWRVVGHNPSALATSGKGNILLLLTKTGGHVGWPMGLLPQVHGWKWMCNAIRDFARSVDKARHRDVCTTTDQQ